MTVPKLSVAASGYQGRGYKNPKTGEVVPGVTTVLDALDKGGILPWHIEQTIAYAVTHLDDLMNRTEEQGMGFLRYKTRPSQKKINEILDTYDDEALLYSGLVLNDLAELGTWIHNYIDEDMNDRFTPEPVNHIHVELMDAYHQLRNAHLFEPLLTEVTIFGNGYAGTADYLGKIDGMMTLGDWKTSRRVYDSHESQLAALGAGETMFREVPEGTPGAIHYELPASVAKHYGGQIDSWWVEEGLPGFQKYAMIQVRPDDDDKPRFAQIHYVDQQIIDAGWKRFQGALAVKQANREADTRRKELSND